MTDPAVKEALKAVFFALAQNQSISKITVRLLCRQAHRTMIKATSSALMTSLETAVINIPGHTDDLVATKITQDDGKFFLYYGDGGYGDKSWQAMITSGISTDKAAQKKSLAWIREQSLSPNCIASLSCHGKEIKPGTISF